jgi:ferredoxin-thioredoxin reductase catalytic subunit
MPDREKVIKWLESLKEYFHELYSYTVEADDERMIDNAIALMKDRTKDYEAWAKEIGVDTCVNCRHASFNRNDGKSTCPIEHNFALVKDGYCHLFIRVEGR